MAAKLSSLLIKNLIYAFSEAFSWIFFFTIQNVEIYVGKAVFFTFYERSTDFVIYKNKNYRFSGRIRTFYQNKNDFYEKKNSVALPRFYGCQNEKFCPPAF
jgi:hypothetical protein